MKIGSEEHKARFCDDFIASHACFDPARLPWPDLDDAALGRLRAIPFWQEVLYTERRAGAIVDAYAATVADPLVRRAVALQGLEEARHAQLLRVMIERYGIDAEQAEPPPVAGDAFEAFADFGYGECLDAFLGFGVFEIARRSGFLPEAMFAIFETLINEEARHIVFFVNWMAWQQAARGHGAWRRGASALRYYRRAAGRLLATVRRGRAARDGRDFSVTQADVFPGDFSLRKLIEECCRAHASRMAAFHPDLLRPRLLPGLGECVLTALRLGRPPSPRFSIPSR